MSKWTEAVLRVRPLLQKGAQSLSNEEALQIKKIYPTWEELVELGSVEADAGYKFIHGEDLYSCINANPEFQTDWVPGVGTESLYTRIDETHTGTLEDPIPYARETMDKLKAGIDNICERLADVRKEK